MSRKAFDNPSCPRCSCHTRKNGHQLEPGGSCCQNYQCTNLDCHPQFQPERPRAKKEPCIRCPVCGRAMEVYKARATYVRCRFPGRKKCHHKLNLPAQRGPSWFLCNFLIPQKALGNKTLAEHAGLGTYRKGSPWQSLYVVRVQSFLQRSLGF